MLFNIELNTIQTIIFMGASLLLASLTWYQIASDIKWYNGKAFRKSAYKRKNLFAKFFLRGLEDLTSKFNIIMKFIENILCIIIILFGILNLCFYLPIFTDIMLIIGIMQFIINIIIMLENDGFYQTKRKR